jgi:hypothetical protein
MRKISLNAGIEMSSGLERTDSPFLPMLAEGGEGNQ